MPIIRGMERWILFESDPRYEISDYGRVRNATTKYVRKLVKDKDGYLRFTPTKGRKTKNYLVHRMVLIAFRPTEDYHKLEVNHLDFDRSNNHLGNLEWTTTQENLDYSRKAGRHEPARNKISQAYKDRVKNGWEHYRLGCFGEESKVNKLTWEQAREARRLRKTTKLTLEEIGVRFGVSAQTISAIAFAHTWVEGDIEPIRKRRPRLTAEEIKNIQNLKKSGQSSGAIAKLLGIGVTTVKRAVNRTC